MERRIRIVNYAINGIGLGHVQRLLAVSRWLRRLTQSAKTKVEIYFLTSSEAAGLLFHERFPSFKFPSITMIDEAGLDASAFTGIARRWVAQTLSLLSPDLLIVDSFPQGYFDELLEALEFCGARALIYRPHKESIAGRPEFQAALSRYDLVLVPETADTANVIVPSDATDKLRYVGMILSREPDEILKRDEARSRLRIKPEETAVYVSAGGGGDEQAERRIHFIHDALRDFPGLHFVIGAGLLYRGQRIYGDSVTWLSQTNAFELMKAFDLAISAAGYNSFNELMYAGVPAIFLPQDKWADDQHARAARAVRAGAAMVLQPEATADDLRRMVASVLDGKLRPSMSEAARQLAPANHARKAADLLLSLLHTGLEHP